MRTLKLGSSGTHVTRLQLQLLAHGYNLGHDGFFGPITDRLVRAFQRARGLTVDGIVGPKTWTALEQGAPAKTRKLTVAALRAEYERDWSGLTIRPNRAQAVARQADTLAGNRARYENVSRYLGIPWQFVAVVHMMECSGSFRHHLHNGDPLKARTVRVPAGRPVDGAPPFTWEASALDALTFDRVDHWTDWSIGGILFKLEGYNGFGPRNRCAVSAYLWAGSTRYTKGKYVSDGVWDPEAVSSQIGAAVLLKAIGYDPTLPF